MHTVDSDVWWVRNSLEFSEKALMVVGPGTSTPVQKEARPVVVDTY